MTNIYQRLQAIVQDAESIPKNGWNSFSKYKYLLATDIVEASRQLMVKHGVFCSITQNKLERVKHDKNFHSHISITAKFVNVDDPTQFVESTIEAVAADTLDKDCYKSLTGAIKYLYILTFKLPVESLDPEKDHAGQNGNESTKTVNTSSPF